MSSPLPVPSKAALTALRGLVVGTSCTLLLVTEDRRRRINAARRVLDNSERLKASQRYLAGGSALSLALEEEALRDQDVIAWSFRDGAGQFAEGRPGSVSATALSARAVQDPRQLDIQSQATRELNTTRSLDPSRLPVPLLYFPPTSHTKYNSKRAMPSIPASSPRDSMFLDSKTVLAASSARRTDTSPHGFEHEVLSRIQGLCEVEEKQAMDDALQLFFQHLLSEKRKAGSLPSKHDEMMLAVSASLCSTCLKLERGHDAAKVLRKMITSGRMSDDEYYRHNPLSIIEAILPQAGSEADAAPLDVATLNIGIDLFLAFSSSEAELDGTRMIAIGKQLLEQCFATQQLGRVTGIFRRTIAHSSNDPSFVLWQISRLCEIDEHLSAINLFVSNYMRPAPRDDSFRKVVDLVVQSATAAYGHKAEQVLQMLLAEKMRLKTSWVTCLLQAHWKRHNDLQSIGAIFETLRRQLYRRVYHLGDVYRVMIKISLEAGDSLLARRYFAELVAKDPSAASNAKVLGTFALAKARIGNWAGVHDDFAIMGATTASEKEARGNAFVPILKEHIRQHSTGETEEFLRRYIEQDGVPIDRHLVGLMARAYGAKRDVKSFLSWLSYCAKAGFPIDASFSNAILTSCRKNWHFSAVSLETVSRKLRSLSPDFVDAGTKRVVLQARVSGPGIPRPGSVPGRLVARGAEYCKLGTVGACATEDNVLLSMSQAIKSGNPGRAVEIYKRATRSGMRPGRGLRLAVVACIQKDGATNCRAAMALLRAAQEQGEDISVASAPLLDASLNQLFSPDSDSNIALQNIHDVVQQFEDNNVRLNDYALNRAALRCLKSGHPAAAIAFASSASRVGKHGGMCYDVFNFGVLLPAYAALCDAKAVLSAVSIAISSDYASDRRCLHTLKIARRWLGRLSTETDEVAVAMDAVERGIEVVKQRRRQLVAERGEIEGEVLRIMGEAALDARQSSEGLQEVPATPAAEVEASPETESPSSERQLQEEAPWQRHGLGSVGEIDGNLMGSKLKDLEYTRPVAAAG